MNSSLITRVTPAVDSRVERQILTGMIVSSQFCQAVKPLWREEALRFPYSKKIGRWCQEYFEKYKQAPLYHIQDIFCLEKATMPQEDSEAIEKFLSDISGEYERSDAFNYEYVMDLSENYFSLSSLDVLKTELNQCLIGGRIEDAEGLVRGYVRPSRPVSQGIDPIKDIDGILEAFRVKELSSLIRLPGHLGDMVGPICRGQLMAYVGASGIGKTWWMLYTGFLAAMRGLNIIYLSFEMPRHEVIRRVQHMVTGLPRLKKNNEDKLLIPIWDCQKNQQGTCDDPRRVNRINLIGKPSFDSAPVGYKPCAACKGEKGWFPDSWFKNDDRLPISEEEVIAKHKSIMSMYGNRLGDFHIVAAPSRSMSISDVKTYIKNREYYEGVITDVVITDSADKMKPDNSFSKDEHRHGIYGIWMAHKALAEELHAAVITASHSNTERSGKRIRQGDWAEDIRKLRESDIAVAINQTPAQKEARQYSVSMLKVRDDDFDLESSSLVLSCLKIGKPCLDSAPEKYLPIEKSKDKEGLKKK